MPRSRIVQAFLAASIAIAGIVLGAPRSNAADAPAAPTTATSDDPLGTVEVDGAADDVPPPKLAIVPLITESDADSLSQVVLRRDLELTGEYAVVDDAQSPDGPFLRDQPIDAAAWRAKGVDFVVSVRADLGSDGVTLVGEVVATATKHPKAIEKRVAVASSAVRLGAHRLADQLIGVLTGRPGSFASRLVFVGAVSSWRRLYLVDADGFDLRLNGPDQAAIVSPTFGPGGEIYYALSRSDAPFSIAHGDAAMPVNVGLAGSILGLSFAPASTTAPTTSTTPATTTDDLAVTVMHDGASQLFVGHGDGTGMHAVTAPPLVSRPVFGPHGHLAYAAGDRVYVDGRPVSPPGVHASSPTFCDGPRGLLVVFSVGNVRSSDLFVSDTAGTIVGRLTRFAGSNGYPACSADGRLVAYFSNRTSGGGPGLYIASIDHPSRAHRVGLELGDSLQWESLTEDSR